MIGKRSTQLGSLLAVAMLVAPLAADEPAEVRPDGRIAPILENLGDHHHAITTSVRQAQQFFDQGLRLAYGFNHAEAIRAFREAARLDPQCAMAYWGHALALGPNINAAMTPEAGEEAYAVLQKAIACQDHVTQQERDYIAALAARYSSNAEADRAALDAAYADAMRELSKKYPDDLDAATLFAEALMDVSPWDYWTRDGMPKYHAEEIVRTLERVIEANPNHPGALHYYIHAVEASKTPERALAAADRLGSVAPGAGHLVHMPAHIYIRVGRYAQASQANVLAIAADDDYITQCRSQGLYAVAYHPHNIHFLWAAATLEGRSEVAIQAANDLAGKVNREMLSDPMMGTLHLFYATPLFALVRFGHWDAIMESPQPDEELIFHRGVWHYARGVAQLRKGHLEAAARELDQIEKLSGQPELETLKIFEGNSLGSVLAIARHVLAGELAAAQGNTEEAVALLSTAVRLDDGLRYNEPHDWHHPPRHILGAVLLEAGRAAEAETVYWADLDRNRENGWALFGLWQSLIAQENTADAADAKRRFQKAWAAADVELTSSRF